MLLFPLPFQSVTVAFPQRPFDSPCSAFPHALLYMTGHCSPGRPGKGNKLMPQAPQRWTGLASRTASTYVTLRCPAHPCLSHPIIVSSTMILLRAALGTSLAVNNIYQDQKRRFGKSSILLTPLESSWFIPRCPDCFLIFLFLFWKMRVLIPQFFIS